MLELINKEKLCKEELWSVLINTICGCFIYYQMPANWLTNPDTVWNAIYYRRGHGGEKANGRILQILVDKFRMNMITPVLTTLFCIVVLAIIAVVINRILDNKNKYVQILIGQVLLFMPCTSSSLTYYYCSDSFILAMLSVVLGVYCIKKYETWQSRLFATGLFFLSLYLYQAYICIVFVFALMILLLEMLRGKKIKEEINRFGHYVWTCIVAVIAYILSFKMFQIVFGINARADRGFDFDNLSIFSEIFLLVKQAYINCYEYFWGNRLLNNQFGSRSVINAIIIFAGIAIISYWYYKKKIWKDLYRSIIILISVVAFPIALEAITIMSPRVDKYAATGIIMIPTMVCVYIFVVTLGYKVTEQYKNKWPQFLAIGGVSLFLWNSVVFTGVCINSMQLQLNKTQTVADVMIQQIVEQYNYESGTKLLVAGSMEDGNFPNLYEWPTEMIKGSSASYGFMWDTFSGNESCWILFLKQYKGLNFSECSKEEYLTVLENEDYQKMPLFPNEGAIKKFGDMVVVKMSNIALE